MAIRAVLVAGLSLAVCSALTWLLVSPYLDREDASEASWASSRPRTDVPSLPGYRSVWANDQPVADRIAPDDRLLEVVLPASPPFAPSHPDPLRQVEFLMEQAEAALVVRLDQVLPAEPPGISYADQTAVTNATVEEVVFDRPRSPWRPGDAIRVESDRGTRVTQIGATLVVQRREVVRAPRRGERYLLFLVGSWDGARTTAGYGYGNAFEIRGSRLVNMSVDTPAAWSGSASVAKVMSLVKRRAGALHARASGDVYLAPRFLR
jgi:hypothetical protein